MHRKREGPESFLSTKSDYNKPKVKNRKEKQL